MKKLSTLLLFILFISCQNKNAEEVDLLLLHSNIIDIQSGTILNDQLVAIKGDTILSVAPSASSTDFTAKTTIDLNGKYVMPGLWDNHVHFRGGQALIEENKDLLPLYLKYGITTVRDAGGDITPSVMAWNAAINSGELKGPKIYTSGPKLDGIKPAWEGSINVTNVEEVTLALDSLQGINVDYVKMYDGSLTKEMFYEIIKQAEQRGLKTTGHMPMDGDIREAYDYGLDGSEHMYYILKACAEIPDSVRDLNLGYGVLSYVLENYNEDLADKTFEKLASRPFFVTPTLYIGKTLSELADADHSKDSTLTHIGEGIQKTYDRRLQQAIRAKENGNNSRGEVNKQFRKMIRPMYDAGISIMAGSDCGASNSFVYPGQSLIGELQQMVAAGLTPQEALTTSVINGPKFFDVNDYYGSVSSGKIADLLILNNNPLDDKEFVILRGVKID